MSAGRGKAIALGSVAAAVGVIVVGFASSWGRLCEEWQLHQLKSKDPATRQAAAESLVESGSLRAIPRLLDLGEDPLVKKVIERRGPAAEPYLAASLRNASEARRCSLALLTLEHFPHHPGALESLAREIGEGDPSRRESALTVLKDTGEDPVLSL